MVPSRLVPGRERASAGAAAAITGRRPAMVSLTPLALSLLALAIWALSLPGVNVRRMMDLGLISVLSPGIFFALVLLTVSFAVALQQVEAYDYRYLPADALSHTDVEAVLRLMTDARHDPAYFLFTRREDAQVDLFYGLPTPGSSSGSGHGSRDRLVDAMVSSGRFTVVYSNADSMILTPAHGGNGAAA